MHIFAHIDWRVITDNVGHVVYVYTPRDEVGTDQSENEISTAR